MSTRPTTTVTGKRIARARAALKAHKTAKEAKGATLDENITDLIADLHHLRHAAGLTVSETVDRMNTLLRIGADHFKIEAQGAVPLGKVPLAGARDERASLKMQSLGKPSGVGAKSLVKVLTQPAKD